MAKTTYTVPEVAGSKRTSERPYTHAIIGRRDGRCSAAKLLAERAESEPRARKWDGKHWDDEKRASAAGVGQLYRNHNGFIVEAREYAVTSAKEFMAKHPDRAAYIEQQAQARADYITKLQASEPGPLGVLQWSMSFKNASKAVATHQSHHSEVRIVECVPVEKKSKTAA